MKIGVIVSSVQIFSDGLIRSYSRVNVNLAQTCLGQCLTEASAPMTLITFSRRIPIFCFLFIIINPSWYLSNGHNSLRISPLHCPTALLLLVLQVLCLWFPYGPLFSDSLAGLELFW